MSHHQELPAHLRKYVVDQFYQRYTPVDQAVWRYIVRQLVSFLSANAHPIYREGLRRTGIEVDQIPHIENISKKLEEFGWKAVPVSGFIPPTAFMEFQALGYLPIASDMRTIEHAMYTPAPDIVHEAAGHAPIIADPEYATYLKKYADVASRSIISHEDLALYVAIRDLSDIKESRSSTPADIAEAEAKLDAAVAQISFASEAAQLARLYWWTAEYGLVGNFENPKIFGAGLLSSPGESQTSLGPSVKKIPLSLDCINYSYDITEPQPQLFVARDFRHLADVLHEFSKTMAYRRGGIFGLERALQAETVNTIELSSGLQISGKLTKITKTQNSPDLPAYLQFSGPCQLAYKNKELPGHGRNFHLSGYGTALGRVRGLDKSLEQMTLNELSDYAIVRGKVISLEFHSGVKIAGTLASTLTSPHGKAMVLTFENCSVTFQGQTLFEPHWGVYDLALGEAVPTVFGGPADRNAFGEVEDFTAKVIPFKEYSSDEKKGHDLYQAIRDLRIKLSALNQYSPQNELELAELSERTLQLPNEWLAALEIYEMATCLNLGAPVRDKLLKSLNQKAVSNSDLTKAINDGLAVVPHLPLMGL